MAFWNKYSGDCHKYYAYLLFKNGIMTTRGCITGKLSIMSHEESEKYENRINRQK